MLTLIRELCHIMSIIYLSIMRILFYGTIERVAFDGK
jgi:hypothetical protein